MRPKKLMDFRPAKYFVFISLGVFCLFLFMEFAVRTLYYFKTQEARFLYWGISQTEVSSNNPRRGYTAVPEMVAAAVDIPEHRDPPPGLTRILVFESGRTGPGGPRGRSAWPEQLESKLARLYFPQKFEVLYGGILAHGVSTARRVLAEELKGYGFHIGILYLGFGDLGGVFGSGVCEWRAIPKSIRILNDISNRLLSFLVLREKFSIWVGQGLEGLYDQNRKEGYCPQEELEAVKKRALESKEEFQRRVEGGLDYYIRDLRDLILEGQSRGMKFLYVRQAHVPDAVPHAKYMSVIWELTDQVIQPLRVPSFDMHSYFQEVGHPEKLFLNYPNNPYHLTVRGADVLTDGLIEAFRILRWFSVQ